VYLSLKVEWEFLRPLRLDHRHVLARDLVLERPQLSIARLSGVIQGDAHPSDTVHLIGGGDVELYRKAALVGGLDEVCRERAQDAVGVVDRLPLPSPVGVGLPDDDVPGLDAVGSRLDRVVAYFRVGFVPEQPPMNEGEVGDVEEILYSPGCARSVVVGAA